MNHNIPQYDFYKHKYGDELLIDVVPLNTIKKYLKEQPVHILTYYDITLITSGEGEFLIDHQANRVKPQEIIFTRPGEIRKWDDKTIQDGFALIFEEEFLLSFFNDPAFLRNLSYFHTERRSSKLRLDKKAYGRISELISEIDKEIKDYQSKDKHLLRALLYETLMLLNRLYASSNALPPDTNARSKSIYVDRFIELVNHSFKQDHSILIGHGNHTDIQRGQVDSCHPYVTMPHRLADYRITCPALSGKRGPSMAGHVRC